jgi:hypothetical protein
MQNWERQQNLVKALQTALECSVYLAPTAPGLSRDEVLEVGKRLEFQEGEIGDALRSAAGAIHWDDGRLLPKEVMLWSQFNLFLENPDFRNPRAFDFVSKELISAVRSVGVQNAHLDRNVLVAKAVDNGLPERDVEAAITIMVLDAHLLEREGVVSFAPGRERWQTASDQLEQLRSSGQLHEPARNEVRARVYEIVKDVLARRTDGRQKSAEPLDAFADALEKLGYGHFQLWWRQMVAELRHADTNLSPVAVSVISAALVEGALTFVVKHARGLGVGVMGSRTFEGDPRTWKIDVLVSSAAAGRDSAILDAPACRGAVELVRIRQRIHAGRMLSEFPGGAPDLRPDEAIEARTTAGLVVRRVLDWLELHPTSTAPNERLGGP